MRFLKSNFAISKSERGATIEEAILASGILALRDDIDLKKIRLVFIVALLN